MFVNKSGLDHSVNEKQDKSIEDSGFGGGGGVRGEGCVRREQGAAAPEIYIQTFHS